MIIMFYNTIELSENDLKKAKRKSESQEKIIKNFFNK